MLRLPRAERAIGSAARDQLAARPALETQPGGRQQLGRPGRDRQLRARLGASTSTVPLAVTPAPASPPDTVRQVTRSRHRVQRSQPDALSTRSSGRSLTRWPMSPLPSHDGDRHQHRLRRARRGEVSKLAIPAGADAHRRLSPPHNSLLTRTPCSTAP